MEPVPILLPSVPDSCASGAIQEPAEAVDSDIVSPPSVAPITRESLRRTRIEMNCSQAQLAKLLGISPNTIACWERGDKQIGNPTILAWALQGVKLTGACDSE